MPQGADYKIAVLISGRGSNLKAILDSVNAGFIPGRIVAVLSDQENAGGLSFAKDNNIPTLVVPRRPKEISNAEFNLQLVTALKPYAPDMIVLAGFMRIISKEFLAAYPRKVINIHPSLLPEFKGLDVQARAIEAGVKESGCTVHFVDEEVDSGPIIAQAKVPVLPDDTAESLTKRILEKEHKLLPSVLRGFCLGQIQVRDDGRVLVKDKTLFPSTGEFLFNS